MIRFSKYYLLENAMLNTPTNPKKVKSQIRRYERALKRAISKKLLDNTMTCLEKSAGFAENIHRGFNEASSID